jgi:hypothetical protein
LTEVTVPESGPPSLVALQLLMLMYFGSEPVKVGQILEQLLQSILMVAVLDSREEKFILLLSRFLIALV